MTLTKAKKKNVVDEIADETFSKWPRDHMIGFLLAAKDDEMFQPKDDSWMNWLDKKLAEECALAFCNGAIAIAEGRTLKSELRGPKKMGMA